MLKLYNDFYLIPVYDGRKSFYKKAKVYQSGNTYTLVSYWTEVCSIYHEIDEDTAEIIDVITINGHYSNTTGRHIREFLKQFFDNPYLELDGYNGTYKYISGRITTDEEEERRRQKERKQEERERKEEELFSKQYDKFMKLYEEKTNFSLYYSEKLLEELLDFYNKEEIIKYIEEMSLSDFKKEVIENCYKILDEYGTKIMKKTIKESIKCVSIDVCGLEYYNIMNDVKMILENY